MNPDAVIRVEALSKSFGIRRVLADVSFEIPQGRAFCILGRSGTGKSVTLKHMIGLMKPDAGRILIEGEDITRLSSADLTRVRRRMGFLFQYAALFDSISVGENVAFPLRRHTRLREPAIRAGAEQKLAQVGLAGEYHKMPAELSGGMRKRAGLARAMALDPSILLVDEPSAGLDPITSREIDRLLARLKQEHRTTLVIVTHNIPSAVFLADELAFMHDGRFLARGTADELARSEHGLVREFMQARGSG